MALTLETVTSSLREHVSLSFLSPSQHDSWRSGALCPGSEILLISLLRPQENRQLMEPARAGKVPGRMCRETKKYNLVFSTPKKCTFTPVSSTSVTIPKNAGGIGWPPSKSHRITTARASS